jgi:putative hydrolase of the HAD superfamily
VSSQSQLILFDLGGVLASLGRPAEQMELGYSDRDFWSVWLGSTTVAQLETGAMHETEFFERFPAELELDESAQAFRRRFLRWRLQLFPGIAEMLSQISETRRIALLSNTNPIHWRMVDPDGDLRQRFDHVFLSYEIGFAKPHRDIFDYVLNALPDNATDLVFLDDTIKNVEGAARCGIHSIHVTGPEGARHALGLGE